MVAAPVAKLEMRNTDTYLCPTWSFLLTSKLRRVYTACGLPIRLLGFRGIAVGH